MKCYRLSVKSVNHYILKRRSVYLFKKWRKGIKKNSILKLSGSNSLWMMKKNKRKLWKRLNCMLASLKKLILKKSSLWDEPWIYVWFFSNSVKRNLTINAWLVSVRPWSNLLWARSTTIKLHNLTIRTNQAPRMMQQLLVIIEWLLHWSHISKH